MPYNPEHSMHWPIHTNGHLGDFPWEMHCAPEASA